MNRTLLGVAARRGTLATLFLMTVVVVAGTVTVLGFAHQAGTSQALAAPLLLLGLIAVPVAGRELGSTRRGEIGLARLRGIVGAELVTLLAAEPLIVLLAGALVGFPLGVLGSWAAGHAWLVHPSSPLSASGGVATVLIVVVGLVAVLAGMSTAIREPLAQQLGTVERPRPVSVPALFGTMLLLAATVVAAYRARLATEDPDWVVLVGPALVGLAAGQLVVWLVRLSAALAMRRTARGTLSAFLAARRLGRAADRVTPIRLLVAAGVLAAVALTSTWSVSRWTDETARIRNGAPLQIPVDTGAAGALAITQALDPDGKWLMAAVVVPEESDTVERRAYVDTSRYDAVVGDFLDDTSAAGVRDELDRLAVGPAPIVGAGDRVHLEVEVVDAPHAGRLRVNVAYVDDQNLKQSSPAAIDLRHAASGNTDATLANCEGGCIVTGLTLEQSDTDQASRILITRLTFGENELAGQQWSNAITSDKGIDVVLEPGGSLELATETADVGLPVLTTPGVEWVSPGQVKSPGGNERRAEVVGEVAALPLVDTSGALADLPRSLIAADATVPAAEVLVLARPDTPASVLDGLGKVGGGEPRSLDDAMLATSDATGAAQSRMYLLLAVACLPIALLVLMAGSARHRAQTTNELAALRLLRVSDEDRRRATRLELAWLVGTAVVVTAVGGATAVLMLLPYLPVISPLSHTAPLDDGLAAWPLVTAVAVAGVLLWWLGGRARTVSVKASRPADLREGAR